MTTPFSILNGFLIFKQSADGAFGDNRKKTQSIRLSSIIGVSVTKNDKDDPGPYCVSIDVAGHVGKTGSVIEIENVDKGSIELLYANLK